MVSPEDHFSKVPKSFRTWKATAKFQTGPMITEMFFHLFLQGTGLYTFFVFRYRSTENGFAPVCKPEKVSGGFRETGPIRFEFGKLWISRNYSVVLVYDMN